MRAPWGENMVKHPLVLVNPRAGRILRDPDLVARIRQRVPAENLFLGRSAEDLYPKLREARENGVQTLMLVGGDGTLSGALTALLRIWPHSELPDLVLAGGGSNNNLAHALGTRGTVEGVLDRFLAAEREPLVNPQRLLRIRPASSESRYGLSLLAGAPARWLDTIDSGPGRGFLARTSESLKTLGSVLVRGDRAKRLAEPIEAEIEIDGVRLPAERVTVIGVSTIREIGLAVSPFDDEAPAHGSFRIGLSSSGPARLSFEVPRLTLGLPVPSCLDVREADFVSLRFPEPLELRLDTEPVPAASTLTIEPGPIVRILRP